MVLMVHMHLSMLVTQVDNMAFYYDAPVSHSFDLTSTIILVIDTSICTTHNAKFYQIVGTISQ